MVVEGGDRNGGAFDRDGCVRLKAVETEACGRMWWRWRRTIETGDVRSWKEAVEIAARLIETVAYGRRRLRRRRTVDGGGDGGVRSRRGTYGL